MIGLRREARSLNQYFPGGLQVVTCEPTEEINHFHYQLHKHVLPGKVVANYGNNHTGLKEIEENIGRITSIDLKFNLKLIV